MDLTKCRWLVPKLHRLTEATLKRYLPKVQFQRVTVSNGIGCKKVKTKKKHLTSGKNPNIQAILSPETVIKKLPLIPKRTKKLLSPNGKKPATPLSQKYKSALDRPAFSERYERRDVVEFIEIMRPPGEPTTGPTSSFLPRPATSSSSRTMTSSSSRTVISSSPLPSTSSYQPVASFSPQPATSSSCRTVISSSPLPSTSSSQPVASSSPQPATPSSSRTVISSFPLPSTSSSQPVASYSPQPATSSSSRTVISSSPLPSTSSSQPVASSSPRPKTSSSSGLTASSSPPQPTPSYSPKSPSNKLKAHLPAPHGPETINQNVQAENEIVPDPFFSLLNLNDMEYYFQALNLPNTGEKKDNGGNNGGNNETEEAPVFFSLNENLIRPRFETPVAETEMEVIETQSFFNEKQKYRLTSYDPNKIEAAQEAEKEANAYRHSSDEEFLPYNRRPEAFLWPYIDNDLDYEDD